jgi:predicted nucleotidyltransferase
MATGGTATGGTTAFHGLPANVTAILENFVGEAQDALGTDLVSVVLFGSAAEGRLTESSDVNLILVLAAFDAGKLNAISDTLQAAEAAIQLRVMFLLESEIPAAVEYFTQKFADIRRRHRVIFGKPVFAATIIPRQPEIFRLRQILFNLTLRLREAYVSRSQQGEQVAHVLAETLGPLRAAAATLMELEGEVISDSGAAFAVVASSFGPVGEAAAGGLIAAHDRKPVTDPQQVLVQTIDLVGHIAARAAQLK